MKLFKTLIILISMLFSSFAFESLPPTQLISIPTAMFLKIGSKGWIEGTAIESLFPKLPFLDQMGLTTLFTMLVIAIVSFNQNKGADDPKGIELKEGVFKTDQVFNIGSFAILLILAAIYSIFW